MNAKAPSKTTAPAKRRLLSALGLLALLVLSAALTACGGGSKSTSSKASTTSATSQSSTPTSSGATTTDASSSTAPAISPSTPVATVAGKPITWGELRHQMAIGPAKREVPEPPGYAACVAHLRLTKSSSSTEALKGECQKLYSEELSPALSSLIHNRWLKGEAAERGVKISQAVVAHELAEDTQPSLKAIAAREGETRADIHRSIVLQQISEALYGQVKAKTPRVSASVIARYYAAHKKSYAIPEQRDLYILRTVSEAAAKKAREEIQAGKSFASLAGASALPQPVHTEKGFLKGLTPGYFSEPVLSKAIFAAKAHTLQGPVKISLGYYVFEVTRITPAHRESLAEAKGAIAKALPEELHRQILAEATKAFKAKWIARTDCLPGFVVPNCKQSSSAGSTPVQDLYTF